MLLSVFLRVLNEAAMLPGCLNRLKNVADQIVIVDSGSTDATVAIAKEYGCKVIRWRGGSASDQTLFTPEGPIYNLALDACRGDWVMLLAADSRLCLRAAAQLRGVLESAEEDNIAFWGVHFLAPGYYSRAWLSHVPGRLVRRDPLFRFDPEAIRGQSFPELGNQRVLKADMALLHHYYYNRHAKTERYYRLRGKPLDTVDADICQEQAGAGMTMWPGDRCGPQCARCFLSEVK
jgi:glycosyltransferase involved in cell wall biosynthesis